MVLKEAFRYQNYLTSLIKDSMRYLTYDNVTTKEENHMKSKTNSEADDETVTVPKTTIYDIDGYIVKPNDIIDFLMDLTNKKEELTKSIDYAKMSSTIDIDSAISLNKQKQELISTLERISDIKSTERTDMKRAYMFNNERNQVPYNYEVKQVVTIDFDRNKVKGIIKKLRRESDEVSANLDKIQVGLEVNYMPVYDLNDKYEDALSTFLSLRKDK